MTPAEREHKNASFAPLTFFRGGGGDTLPLRHLPGYQEAGGDSSHSTYGRNKRPYSHKLATVKRDQYAATRLEPPPGFAQEITAAQQHRMNLEWWISKREDMRIAWEKEREAKLAKAKAKRLEKSRPLGGKPSQRADNWTFQPRRTTLGGKFSSSSGYQRSSSSFGNRKT